MYYDSRQQISFVKTLHTVATGSYCRLGAAAAAAAAAAVAFETIGMPLREYAATLFMTKLSFLSIPICTSICQSLGESLQKLKHAISIFYAFSIFHCVVLPKKLDRELLVSI